MAIKRHSENKEWYCHFAFNGRVANGYSKKKKLIKNPLFEFSEIYIHLKANKVIIKINSGYVLKEERASLCGSTNA